MKAPTVTGRGSRISRNLYSDIQQSPYTKRGTPEQALSLEKTPLHPIAIQYCLSPPYPYMPQARQRPNFQWRAETCVYHIDLLAEHEPRFCQYMTHAINPSEKFLIVLDCIYRELPHRV